MAEYSQTKAIKRHGVVMGGTTPEDSHRELLPTQVSLVVPPRCTESIRQSGAFLNSTRGYESQTVLSYRGVRTRRLPRQFQGRRPAACLVYYLNPVIASDLLLSLA